MWAHKPAPAIDRADSICIAIGRKAQIIATFLNQIDQRLKMPANWLGMMST